MSGNCLTARDLCCVDTKDTSNSKTKCCELPWFPVFLASCEVALDRPGSDGDAFPTT